MIPQHIRKHFLTEKGRGQLFTTGTLIASTVFGFNLASQTFLINKYRNFVHLYKSGLATPVPLEVQQLGQEVLNDMKFTHRSKSFVEFFSVCGFDLFYLGSIKSRHGAYVGIPGNYAYKSTDDVEVSDIMVETKPVIWSSEGGQLFQESLILSQEAQKFGIARQLAFLSTNHYYFFSGVNAMPILVYMTLSNIANTKFYGLHKPFSFRLFVYSFVAVFTFGLWTFMKDMLTKYYENSADKVASSLGPTYAKGGIEFYAKALQKNIALRLLMSNGESKFTMFGNENELIRQRHVPLTVRKENVLNAFKKIQNSESDKDVNTN